SELSAICSNRSLCLDSANCLNTFNTCPSSRFSSTETVLNSSNRERTIPLFTKKRKRKASISSAVEPLKELISSVYFCILVFISIILEFHIPLYQYRRCILLNLYLGRIFCVKIRH